MTAPVSVVASPITRRTAAQMAAAVRAGEAAGDVALAHLPTIRPEQSVALVVQLLNALRPALTTADLSNVLMDAWHHRVGVEAPVHDHVLFFAQHLAATGTVPTKGGAAESVSDPVCVGCHKFVPRLRARHLCPACHQRHHRQGTLAQFPLMRQGGAA